MEEHRCPLDGRNEDLKNARMRFGGIVSSKKWKGKQEWRGRKGKKTVPGKYKGIVGVEEGNRNRPERVEKCRGRGGENGTALTGRIKGKSLAKTPLNKFKRSPAEK